LELMNYPDDRITLLLNRADTSVGISQDDATGILGRAPDICVPSDKTVVKCINAGEPVTWSDKNNDVSKAYRHLASLYSPEVETDEDSSSVAKRFNLLRRA
jgi:pilus assembly protein CpaE